MLTTKNALAISFTASCLIGINSAHAELLVNPAEKTMAGKNNVAGYYGTSEVTYKDDESSNKDDVERTFIGATVAHGLNDKVDVFGGFALITDAETQVDDTPTTDGDGNAFAFGVRGKLPVGTNLNLHGYAQYLMIDEDYKINDASASADDTTISVGAVAVKQSDDVTFYGGLELVLSTDTDFSFTFPGGSGTGSAERDDTLGFRLGAQFQSGDMDINVSTAFSHEKGIMIGASADL